MSKGPAISSQDQRRYSRLEAMKLLGIRSRTTLTGYCNDLKIPAGKRYFTEEEFAEIEGLRSWCKDGCRKSDYLNIRRKATPISWSARKNLQSTSA